MRQSASPVAHLPAHPSTDEHTASAQQFSPATVRYSFAGSDVLAAQIEQGIKPDVNTHRALIGKGVFPTR